MKRTSFIATTAIASAIILCSQAQAGGLTGSLGGGSLAGSLNGGLVRAGGDRAGVVVIVLEVSISVAVIVKDRKVIGTQQVDDAKVESVLKLKGIGNSNTVPDRPEPTSPRVQGPIVAVNHAAEPPSGTAFSTLSRPAQRPLPASLSSSRSSAAAPPASLSL